MRHIPDVGFRLSAFGFRLYRARMTTTETDLLRTAFHKFHVDHGAKLVNFVGWEMPLLYSSIIEEHRQVRASGGIFDVSHMGRLAFTGRDARRFLDHVCTRQIHGMQDGQVRYSLVCNEAGGCRDDVLVYRLGDDDYLMVCNAANRGKLLEHFAAVKGEMVFKLEDQTVRSAMVAVQGPKVMEVIGHYSSSIPALKRYHCTTIGLLGMKVIVSRTGYTGEDGVEVICSLTNPVAKMAFKTLINELTKVEAIAPTGLGARDSLRLEAGMALYGHEISEDLDPVSAGLTFAIRIDKSADDPEVGRFIGQDALQRIAEQGPQRHLRGLVLDSPRAARPEMKVLAADSEIGFVTSGCLSPTLDQSIAMAYLPTEHAEAGTTVQVDLGRQAVDATVVMLPFYKAK
jgi:aminomethyltransferase